MAYTQITKHEQQQKCFYTIPQITKTKKQNMKSNIGVVPTTMIFLAKLMPIIASYCKRGPINYKNVIIIFKSIKCYMQ